MNGTVTRQRDKSSLGRSYTTSTSGYVSIRSGIRPQSEKNYFKIFRCAVSCYNSRLITVEPVIFFYMFALYLYEVIFQLYVFNTYAHRELVELNRNTSNASECLTTESFKPNHTIADKVQTETAILSLIVGSTTRLPSIVATLILGPLSDRFGRKPSLIFVIVGMLVPTALAIVIINLNLNLHYFILSSGIRGLSGGMAGILTVCYSYVADVSSRKWLTVRLGLLEAMTIIAGSMSLLTGGVWTELVHCNFKPAAWAILACISCAFLYGLIVVPESLDQDMEQRNKEQAKVGPRALLKGFRIFFKKGYQRWKLWICLFVMVVTVLNMTGTTAIIALYLLHDPLHWKPLKIGVFLASSEFIRGIGLIVVLPILIASSVPDGVIALIGIVLSLSMDVCFGFVEETWQAFTVGVVLGAEALITPALKAIMSKAVAPADQGALFSFISAVQVLASVVAFAGYSFAYSQGLKLQWKHASGLTFMVMAALYLTTIPVLLVLLYFQRKEHNSPTRFRRNPRRQVPPSVNATPTVSQYEQSTVVNSADLWMPKSELAQEALDRASLLHSENYDTRSELSMSYHSVSSYRPI